MAQCALQGVRHIVDISNALSHELRSITISISHRSFDDGLSECGLVCPGSILALDGRLDPYYRSDHGEHKASPVNTHFPCG